MGRCGWNLQVAASNGSRTQALAQLAANINIAAKKEDSLKRRQTHCELDRSSSEAPPLKPARSSSCAAGSYRSYGSYANQPTC